MESPSPPPDGLARRERLALVAAAALFRVVLLAVTPRVVHGDEAAYLLMGRSIWQGGPVQHIHPPLVPFLAGGVWRATGSPELANAIWFVLFGALLLVPLTRLAEIVAGRRAALVAGALAVVYPALTSGPLFWSSMTEPPFALLVYSAAACALVGVRSDRPALVAAAGALLVLAYLTRPEGLIWAGTLGLAIVADGMLRRRPFVRRTLRDGALLAAAFVVATFPYLLWVRIDTGRWSASGKLAVTWELGDAALAGDHQMYDRLQTGLDAQGKPRWETGGGAGHPGFVSRLLHEPGHVLQRIAGNSARLLRRAVVQPLFPLPLALLAAVALLARPRSRERLAGDVWVAAAALPVAAFVLFSIEARYFSPATPALLVWAGAGADELARRLAPRPQLRAAVLAVFAAAIVAALVYGHGPALADRRAGVFPSRRDAGRWIGAHAPAGARVMAFDDAYGVYADRAFLISPRLPWEELVAYARRQGVAYLVVEGDEVRNYRPFLAPILAAETAPASPPGLELAFRDPDPRNPVNVFRLAPAPGG